jgi:hypothetical protein
VGREGRKEAAGARPPARGLATGRAPRPLGRCLAGLARRGLRNVSFAPILSRSAIRVAHGANRVTQAAQYSCARQ